MVQGFNHKNAQIDAWRDDLGGKRCYGRGGRYDACGDGYGDDYMGAPLEDSGTCVDQPLSGLPYAMSAEQRTANATAVVGGECFTSIERDEMVLSDCRRRHSGRVFWGRATASDPKVNLPGICEVNEAVWPGFADVQLIETDGVFACVALRTGQSK